MAGVVAAQASQPAVRATRPGWRDPRLWVGVAIVAASVLAGARLVGGADDTVAVWAVADDMAVGEVVAVDDLVPRRVRFSESLDADRYLPADLDVPSNARLVRDVGAGELLPRAALGAARDAELEEVPVWAPSDAVPPTIASGSVVDVWVTPETGATGRQPAAELVLDDVVVLGAPQGEGSLGPSGTRQVLVGVTPEQVDDLPRALAAASAGRVVITRQG